MNDRAPVKPARDGTPPPRPAQPFNVIRPVIWQDKDIPERVWLVENLLDQGGISMISGDGGIGKSLLMQQLLTCSALGCDWLGLKVAPMKTLGIFCEDNPAELQRRQDAINRHYGCDMVDLDERLFLQSRVGFDNVLMDFNRFTERGIKTPLFDQLERFIEEEGIQLLFLDTAADIFGGNENARPQVRAFVNAIRALTIKTEGGVIISAHPSAAGLATGSGVSGSTGWNNSVRLRVYLTKPRNDQGEEERRTNERLLKGMKSNYSQGFDEFRLSWENGVFIRLDAGGSGGVVDRIEIDRALVDGLRELVTSGQLVAAAAKARNGFASLIRDLPSCSRFTYKTCLTAQSRLIEAGKIVKVELGPQSKRYTYLRTPDTLYPGEAGDIGGPLGGTA